MSVYFCNCGLFQRPIEDCPTKKCKKPNKRLRASKILIKEGIYPSSESDGIFSAADMPPGFFGR